MDVKHFFLFFCLAASCQASCRNSNFGKKKKCLPVIKAVFGGTSDRDLFEDAWENPPLDTVISKTKLDAASSSTAYEPTNFYEPNFNLPIQTTQGFDLRVPRNKNIGQDSSYFSNDSLQPQTPKPKSHLKQLNSYFPDYKNIFDKENFQSNIPLTGGFKPLNFDLYSPQKYLENYYKNLKSVSGQHPSHKYTEVDYFGKEYEKYLSKFIKNNDEFKDFAENGDKRSNYFDFHKLSSGEINPYLASLYEQPQMFNNFNNKPIHFENSDFVPSNFGKQKQRYNGRKRKQRRPKGLSSYKPQSLQRQRCRGSGCYKVIRKRP